MSYNLLCKLFGRTFWPHILVAHLLTQICDKLRKYVAIIVTAAVLLPVSGSPVSERKCLPD